MTSTATVISRRGDRRGRTRADASRPAGSPVNPPTAAGAAGAGQRKFASLGTPRVVRAPRGMERTCKTWQAEAALRMLMNNLDPEVAEHPEQLVVYGGRGQAARSWPAFEAIVATLRRLEADETLLVQSGKPV